jgi:cyclic beta-1,2-glucan synthetase
MATTHGASFDLRLAVSLPGRAAAARTRSSSKSANALRCLSNLDSLQELRNWSAAQPSQSRAALEVRWTAAIEQIKTSGLRPISDNARAIDLASREAKAGIAKSEELAHITSGSWAGTVPRALAVASAYLQRTDFSFDEGSFEHFIADVEQILPLDMFEVWNLKPFLELALLEKMGEAATEFSSPGNPVSAGSQPQSEARRPEEVASLVDALLQVSGTEWKEVFERVSLTEAILKSDPLNAYADLDYETREAYRAAVAKFAAHSHCSECEVASKAISLARLARSNAAVRRTRTHGDNETHVGYYLVGAGRDTLKAKIGYRPSRLDRIREAVLRRPTRAYFAGISLTTAAFYALLIAVLHGQTVGVLMAALLVLPAIECAVATVNLFANRVFPPKKLPKLDFSEGIPADCATVVTIPALLSSEKQVRSAVQGLEVRFLANRDPYLNFVLLTDLPDSAEQFDERERLAEICSKLVQKLDQKYRADNRGRLFHFHRHRVYNETEKLWMGWERKRGKLLDFNRFLLGQDDAFAMKTGDWSSLQTSRYVITLDIDTQLPPGAAHKLIGTIAHPLNRAVIDPATNMVVDGYAILQPRVDVSVRSAGGSRLAALLSGDTGFDIYTRAVSDTYQDLFGEAIFTGKGIYEVEAFQKVLEHRFPNNAILSHDLIEGLYARTGLVSDVEVVDDYPSHYSAFSRRKHRWIRGDWQILFSLFPRVPDYFGYFVRNPLSYISRWKIFDNLRRSLTEFSLLLLLLYGWLQPPQQALRWTIAAVTIMLLPTLLQSALGLLTAGRDLFTAAFWRNLGSDFAASCARTGVRVALLCQQSLIDLDAIVRTVVRMKFTRRRLLEWETAAETEASVGRTSFVDSYLRYSLLFTVALAVGVFWRYSRSLGIAAPFLILWASAVWVRGWLNRPPRSASSELPASEQQSVRFMSLGTWRFFRDFSNAEENWLIPDIVQDSPALVAHRVSPTNLGLLFNARQAAHDFGFVTTEEFVHDTQKTLATVHRMPRCRGHLYNWYTTDTLEPVAPLFVSTVDNGNLLCSLWTLKHGCLELIRQPILRPALIDGIRDHIEMLAESLAKECPANEWTPAIRDMRRRVAELAAAPLAWAEGLRALEIDVAIFFNGLSRLDVSEETSYHARELSIRVTNVLRMVRTLAPWLDSRFREACSLSKADMRRFSGATLESIPRLYQELLHAPGSSLASSGLGANPRLASARTELKRAITHAEDLSSKLSSLAKAVDALADEMDFSILYDSKKRLFSIGYEESEGEISKYNYDLLASEARTAVFAAVAKGEALPESWFQLKRSFRSYKGEDVLLSWSGTTFEYLMPTLWIKSDSNTLLDRGVRSAIRAQQKFAAANSIPWGISESSCNQRNPDGHYRYHAFGVPGLALHTDDCTGDLVVAPYATFLAMAFDPEGAGENLRKLVDLGGLSRYGFYEAIDFTSRRTVDGKPEIVRNWMAHHQGMSLVAAANALCDSSMQKRFHAEPRVASVERLLHERFPRAIPYEAAAEVVAPVALPTPAEEQSVALGAELPGLMPKVS